MFWNTSPSYPIPDACPGEECARAGLVLTIQDIPVDMSQIEQLIAAFFWAHAIEAPGIQPSDLAQTLAAMLPK